jgi:N-acetylglucosamine kinase-like BadF-type ATPase
MASLLGLDIGGSRSRARLCVGGTVVADAESGSASVPAAGLDAARAAMSALLAQLPLSPGDRVDAVCAGAAGISVPACRQFLHESLAPLARDGTVLIVPDSMLVLPAAGLGSGIAVICGTGSSAVGTWQGRQARAGGWGYLLGDEGGGYSIVRSAVRELLGRRDRGGPPGRLAADLLAAAGAGSVNELAEQFYADPRPRHWAQHAPLVLDSDDPAAARILGEAAGALAGLAAETAGRLHAPRTAPVVLAGGLAGHQRLERATRAALTGKTGFPNVSKLATAPVAGALRLAAATIGG